VEKSSAFYARITLAIGDHVCVCVCDSWPIRKKRIAMVKSRKRKRRRDRQSLV